MYYNLKLNVGCIGWVLFINFKHKKVSILSVQATTGSQWIGKSQKKVTFNSQYYNINNAFILDCEYN